MLCNTFLESNCNLTERSENQVNPACVFRFPDATVADC